MIALNGVVSSWFNRLKICKAETAAWEFQHNEVLASLKMFSNVNFEATAVNLLKLIHENQELVEIVFNKSPDVFKEGNLIWLFEYKEQSYFTLLNGLPSKALSSTTVERIKNTYHDASTASNFETIRLVLQLEHENWLKRFYQGGGFWWL